MSNAPGPTGAGAPATVLVIDDDDAIREIAQVALEMVCGWTTLASDSGRAGLELARRHRPDAILLDVMMPDLDGVATFRLLQSDASTAEIPVVLVTAKTRVDERQSWDGLAIAGVISKPFDPMTLGDQVARLVGWH